MVLEKIYLRALALTSLVKESVESIIYERSEMERQKPSKKSLKENIIEQLESTTGVVFLNSLADKFGISKETVRKFIDEIMTTGLINGRYTFNGSGYLTDNALKQILKDRLR